MGKLSGKQALVTGAAGGIGEGASVAVLDLDLSRAVAAAEVVATFGGIDILVNNAGIDTTSRLVDMPTAMWDDMMRVNLRSVFLCTRAMLPGMIAQGSGRIISTASQLGHKGAPEMAHYAAAKAGVIASRSRWPTRWDGRASPSTRSAWVR